MKKLSILFGLLLVLGLTATAMADVDVTATINKEKDKTVTETIDIDKNVDINITVDEEVVRASEAEGVLNQRNENNVVRGLQSNATDENRRSALIEASINANLGIVGVNQDGGGNMNNQANMVSMSTVFSEEPLPGFANSQASAEQINQNNSVNEQENTATGPHRIDKILSSINENHSIVGVNQSSGNMNNQANMVVIAVAENALVAISEAALGQRNAFNTVNEIGTVKVASIIGSINGNTGIVGVNQSSGNMNNQANVVSISSSTFLPILNWNINRGGR